MSNCGADARARVGRECLPRVDEKHTTARIGGRGRTGAGQRKCESIGSARPTRRGRTRRRGRPADHDGHVPTTGRTDERRPRVRSGCGRIDAAETKFAPATRTPDAPVGRVVLQQPVGGHRVRVGRHLAPRPHSRADTPARGLPVERLPVLVPGGQDRPDQVPVLRYVRLAVFEHPRVRVRAEEPPRDGQQGRILHDEPGQGGSENTCPRNTSAWADWFCMCQKRRNRSPTGSRPWSRRRAGMRSIQVFA